MNAILTIAGKELKDGFRNRWLLTITLVFTVMASSFAWLGASSVGSIGFTSIANTIMSLASLNIFLLPLIALLLSYNSIVGEDEDGTLLLLLTYPLTKIELLFGKFLGHTFILTIATIIGFGSAAIIIAIFAEDIDLIALFHAFGIFVISAILLGMIFISISYVISSWATEKSKAAGIALITWFFFVLLYDMGLLAILIASKGQIQAELFPYLLLLNPTDIFRLINLTSFNTNGTGLLSIASEDYFSLSTLIFAMLIWIITPFTVAYYIFKKRLI